MTVLKCPFCDYMCDNPEDLVYHWDEPEKPHLHSHLARDYKLAKMIVTTIPISKIEAAIEHWEGHGISLDLDSPDVVKVLKDLLRDQQ